MIEEILPHLFRMEIPLPNNPLKALNSYLIRGSERCLLIDTGMNLPECRQAMTGALQKLKVDLERTDLFITHLHSDHLGLAGALASSRSKIYFNHIEGDFISRPERRQESYSYFLANGFPEKILKKALESHPGYQFGLKQSMQFSIVEEGDVIQAGDYSFTCVETPGHSPGHMCLYEKEQKILVAGDHILIDITPNITYWPSTENSLKRYLQSLDKVYAYDVKLVLPGHRRIWKDHRERINELKQHHKSRLDEVISALEEGERNAFQIAPRITWDLTYNSWEQFPPAQQWFALGETIAHIEYLEAQGKLKRNMQDNSITFSLAA